MKVKDFVENFVGHNSTICIYNQKRIPDEPGNFEFIKLWEGMDWQATSNSDDIAYCKDRGFEICPYAADDVVQVKNLPHGEFSDYIDLIIGKLL